ncbi:hypothetical protein BDQ17DRAFT_1376697 [Cyathus striatus]|nr:hypothetical protein BDQ17DRAFT_1376697 [Cyathus striatus]
MKLKETLRNEAQTTFYRSSSSSQLALTSNPHYHSATVLDRYTLLSGMAVIVTLQVEVSDANTWPVLVALGGPGGSQDRVLVSYGGNVAGACRKECGGRVEHEIISIAVLRMLILSSLHAGLEDIIGYMILQRYLHHMYASEDIGDTRRMGGEEDVRYHENVGDQENVGDEVNVGDGEVWSIRKTSRPRQMSVLHIH